MKKNKRPPQKSLPEDLDSGKWVMDVQYSRQGINSNAVAFSDSKSIAKQVESRNIHNQILRLHRSIAGHERNISALQKKEQQLLNSSENSNEHQAIQEQINHQKARIDNRRHQIRLLQQKLIATSSSETTPHRISYGKPSPQSPNIISSSSNLKEYPYPVISIGDYLYHKTYGYGLVYLKCIDFFKVFFANKSIHSFSYQDPAFENLTLTQLNHWNTSTKSYATTFSHVTSSFSIPTHLQTDYSRFVTEQYDTLTRCISRLPSVFPETSLQYYAQQALNSIYNIQHSEEVFSSLKAIEKVSTPPSKVSPVSNQLKSSNSKSSLHEKVYCTHNSGHSNLLVP